MIEGTLCFSAVSIRRPTGGTSARIGKDPHDERGTVEPTLSNRSFDLTQGYEANLHIGLFTFALESFGSLRGGEILREIDP